MYLMALNGTLRNGEGVRAPKGHATLGSVRFSVRRGPELNTGSLPTLSYWKMAQPSC